MRALRNCSFHGLQPKRTMLMTMLNTTTIMLMTIMVMTPRSRRQGVSFWRRCMIPCLRVLLLGPFLFCDIVPSHYSAFVILDHYVPPLDLLGSFTVMRTMMILMVAMMNWWSCQIHGGNVSRCGAFSQRWTCRSLGRHSRFPYGQQRAKTMLMMMMMTPRSRRQGVTFCCRCVIPCLRVSLPGPIPLYQSSVS